MEIGNCPKEKYITKATKNIKQIGQITPKEFNKWKEVNYSKKRVLSVRYRDTTVIRAE